MPVYYTANSIPAEIANALIITQGDPPLNLGDLPAHTLVVTDEIQDNHEKIIGIVNRRPPLFAVFYVNNAITSRTIYIWSTIPSLDNHNRGARKAALGDDWTWFHVPSQQFGPIRGTDYLDASDNRVNFQALRPARQEDGNPGAAPANPGNPGAANPNPGNPGAGEGVAQEGAAPANPGAGILNRFQNFLSGSVANVRQESAPGIQPSAPVFEDDNLLQVEGFKVIGHSTFTKMVRAVKDATDGRSSHRIILPKDLIPSDYNPTNALIIPAYEVDENGTINQTFSGKFRYRLQQDGISLGKFIKVCGTFFILLVIINFVFFLHDIGYAEWECLLVFVVLTILYSILTIKIYIDKV